MSDIETTIEKKLLDTREAMQYLGIEKRSTFDNLIRTGRLTPLKIAKNNYFARSELDAMIQRELAKERRLRGTTIGVAS